MITVGGVLVILGLVYAVIVWQMKQTAAPILNTLALPGNIALTSTMEHGTISAAPSMVPPAPPLSSSPVNLGERKPRDLLFAVVYVGLFITCCVIPATKLSLVTELRDNVTECEKHIQDEGDDPDGRRLAAVAADAYSAEGGYLGASRAVAAEVYGRGLSEHSTTSSATKRLIKWLRDFLDACAYLPGLPVFGTILLGAVWMGLFYRYSRAMVYGTLAIKGAILMLAGLYIWLAIDQASPAPLLLTALGAVYFACELPAVSRARARARARACARACARAPLSCTPRACRDAPVRAPPHARDS